jgi:hypothetical protein
MPGPRHKVFPKWMAAAAVAVSSAGVAGLPASGAEPPVLALTCTNLASGTGWQIAIDLKAATVDSNPARISSTEISWHDADGGNYTLDRKTGNLTAVFASSTGGYFIHHHCQPRT